MKRKSIALGVLASMLLGLAIVNGGSEATNEKAIYVLSGPEPANVSTDSLVRIEAGGIAGSSITAKVTGPAKVQKFDVIRLIEGKQPLGAYDAEFLITPTGKGKVSAVVTVTYPTGGDPKKENYTITFE